MLIISVNKFFVLYDIVTTDKGILTLESLADCEGLLLAYLQHTYV